MKSHDGQVSGGGGCRLEKSEGVEIPHPSSPVLAAAEQQELAGMIVDRANRSVVRELRQLLSCLQR